MLVALSFFWNAPRTYFWQPAHVTPVICTTYAVVFASLSAAATKPRLRAKTPIVAMINFFIINKLNLIFRSIRHDYMPKYSNCHFSLEKIYLPSLNILGVFK